MGNGSKVPAVLVLAMALVACGASSASAQLSVGASVSVKATVYIEGPLTGEKQPLDGAGKLLCTAGQKVGGHLPNGDPVDPVLCAIPALDYQYVTRFKDSSGEIVRRHTALLNVPTPLNVDRDIEPDVIGTAGIELIPLATTFKPVVGVEIDRRPFETADLPLKV